MCFNFSHLCFGSLTLHSDTVSLVPRLSPQRRPPIDLHEMFNCTYLKFTVSGLSKQPSIDTHTVPNVVTLVWGSLRFSPIMNSLYLFFTCVLIGPKHHLAWSTLNIHGNNFIYMSAYTCVMSCKQENCFVPRLSPQRRERSWYIYHVRDIKGRHKLIMLGWTKLRRPQRTFTHKHFKTTTVFFSGEYGFSVLTLSLQSAILLLTSQGTWL